MSLPVTHSRSVHELRQRVLRMQGAGVSRTLESLPGLAEVIRLRTGGAYVTDSPSLAMALLAGPSAAGEWSAVVGVPDFGLEAAARNGSARPRPGVRRATTAPALPGAGVAGGAGPGKGPRVWGVPNWGGKGPQRTGSTCTGPWSSRVRASTGSASPRAWSRWPAWWWFARARRLP